MNNIVKLVEKYNTPLYIYDFNKINNNYQKFKNSFYGQKSLIAYAIKANSNLSIIKELATLGAGADCVSIGEVRRAILADVDSYKIIFSGIGKSDDEIKEAIKFNILFINLESEAEMKRVEKIAKSLNQKVRISIRVNPNISVKTHPYISTGLHENKFGVNLDDAKRMYIYSKQSKFLNPIGVHFHIGSQLLDIEPIRDSCKIVADLVQSLKAIDIDIKFFNIGGGVGVKYKDETTINIEDYANSIKELVKRLDVTVIAEPGRYIVADAGNFLTKVLYKKNNFHKNFIIVDGAMNDLIRPSLYNAYHKVEAIDKSGDEVLVDIVGPVCESGDFLAKDVYLPELEHNDILKISTVGAYGFTMSSNYNTRNKVAEVGIKDGKDFLIRERENFEYQIKLEISDKTSWKK